MIKLCNADWNVCAPDYLELISREIICQEQSLASKADYAAVYYVMEH